MGEQENGSELHFVFGAARSGTTWLSRALSTHPEVFATEQRLFGDFSEVWPGRNGVAVPRISGEKYLKTFWQHFQTDHRDQREDIPELLRRWIRFIGELSQWAGGKRIVIDKVTPWFGLEESIFRSIRRNCPQSRVIFLLRDGRDVVTSGLFDSILRQPGRPLRKLFVQGKPSGWRMERLFDDESVSEWARYWDRIAGVILANPELPVVRYEQMLENQSVELGRIFKILDVSFSAKQLEDSVKAASFKAVTGREPGDGKASSKHRRGVSGDWKNWFTRRDGEIFSRLAGQSLVRMGYLADESSITDWIESLPDRLDLE